MKSWAVFLGQNTLTHIQRWCWTNQISNLLLATPIMLESSLIFLPTMAWKNRKCNSVHRNFSSSYQRCSVTECLRPATLLKKRHRCFPVNFAKFLRTPILQNTSGRLLLDINLCQNIFFNKVATASR